MDIIAFRKVKEPFGWMSNMSPHGVGEYRTAEAFFQALRFNDPVIRAEIKAQKSPMAAKMVAKKHADKMIVVPRSPKDLEQMDTVLGIKLQVHPGLEIALERTGDATIIEDCTNRPNESGLFWGAALRDNGVWVGDNRLGKLWMQWRSHLRALKQSLVR